jgi:BolA protein
MRARRSNLQVLTTSINQCGAPRQDGIDAAAWLPLSGAMTTRDLITEKLTAAFTPQRLEVLDESHQHVGHAGHRPGGETHFRVHIVSEAFRGKSRLQRHRLVNETLSGELQGGVHALAIQANAPGEGE